MLKRRRHRAQRGQVLVLAVAFIGFFGAVSISVLRFADRAYSQRMHTEATAKSDTLAEGGALFAAADGSRTGSTCAALTHASLTMENGDVAGYTVNACDPGTSGGGGSAFCVLCLINPGNATTSKSNITVDGPIDINGTVSVSNATMTSTGPNAFIGCVVLATCTGSYAPSPTKITAVTDPLAGLAIPSVAVHQTQGGSTTLNPGIYSTISAGGNTTLTLNSGIYVITGSFSTSGNSGVVSSGSGGVLLYFACSNYPTPCKTSGTKATFSADGNGGVNLTPYASAPYAGISMFVDPDSNATITFGKGGTPNLGTFYGRSAAITVNNGNGSLSVSGRLIVGSLNAGNNSSLSPVGANISACTVYDDTVSGTSGSTTSSGRVVLETACSGGTGIVDFNYHQ